MNNEQIEKVLSNLSLLKQYTILYFLHTSAKYAFAESLTVIKKELKLRGVSEEAIYDHLKSVQVI